MSEGIIDLLHTVDIHDHDDSPAAFLLTLSEKRIQYLLTAQSVIGSGQTVLHGQIGESSGQLHDLHI